MDFVYFWVFTFFFFFFKKFIFWVSAVGKLNNFPIAMLLMCMACCMVCSLPLPEGSLSEGRDCGSCLQLRVWDGELCVFKWCRALHLSKTEPSSILNKLFTLLMHPPAVLFILFFHSHFFVFLSNLFLSSSFLPFPANCSYSAFCSCWQPWAPQFCSSLSSFQAFGFPCCVSFAFPVPHPFILLFFLPTFTWHGMSNQLSWECVGHLRKPEEGKGKKSLDGCLKRDLCFQYI